MTVDRHGGPVISIKASGSTSSSSGGSSATASSSSGSGVKVTAGAAGRIVTTDDKVDRERSARLQRERDRRESMRRERERTRRMNVERARERQQRERQAMEAERAQRMREETERARALRDRQRQAEERERREAERQRQERERRQRLNEERAREAERQRQERERQERERQERERQERERRTALERRAHARPAKRPSPPSSGPPAKRPFDRRDHRGGPHDRSPRRRSLSPRRGGRPMRDSKQDVSQGPDLLAQLERDQLKALGLITGTGSMNPLATLLTSLQPAALSNLANLTASLAGEPPIDGRDRPRDGGGRDRQLHDRDDQRSRDRRPADVRRDDRRDSRDSYGRSNEPPMRREDPRSFRRDDVPMRREDSRPQREPLLHRDDPRPQREPLLRRDEPRSQREPPPRRDEPRQQRRDEPLRREEPRGPPRRDEPSGRRDEPPVRRDAPLRREEPPVRRDERSYRRDDPPSRRDDGPYSRPEPAYRREDPPLRRDEPPLRRDAPPIRRDAPPVRRDEPPLRRDEPPLRRDEPPLRRDEPPPRREEPPPRRAEAPREDMYLSRQDDRRLERERIDTRPTEREYDRDWGRERDLREQELLRERERERERERLREREEEQRLALRTAPPRSDYEARGDSYREDRYTRTDSRDAPVPMSRERERDPRGDMYGRERERLTAYPPSTYPKSSVMPEKKKDDDWPTFHASGPSAAELARDQRGARAPVSYPDSRTEARPSGYGYDRARSPVTDRAQPVRDFSTVRYGRDSPERQSQSSGLRELRSSTSGLGATDRLPRRSAETHDYGHTSTGTSMSLSREPPTRDPAARSLPRDIDPYGSAADASGMGSGPKGSGILSAAELAELAHIVQLQQRGPGSGMSRSSAMSSSEPRVAGLLDALGGYSSGSRRSGASSRLTPERYPPQSSNVYRPY